MVGMLGCGCCGCCPEGNTWTYSYYPETPGWPLESYANQPGVTTTPDGIQFLSPTVIGINNQIIRSVKPSVTLPQTQPEPPIKVAFGKSDERNLQHVIRLPTRTEMASWQTPPVSEIIGLRVSISMRVELLLAMRVDATPPFYPTFGLRCTWTKYSYKTSGRIYTDYALLVQGMSGITPGPISASLSKVYGPSPNISNFYFHGDFFPNELNVQTARNTVSQQYDCTAYRFAAWTKERSDNLLIDPWKDYILNGFYQSFVDKLSCWPHYSVQVTWFLASAEQGVGNASFNGSRVLLRKTDWKENGLLA